MLLSDAFRIGGLDARCLARNHSGALVDDAGSGPASDEALVRCPQRRRFRQRLPGRAARGRAAQDRLRRAEAAGDPGPWRQQAILGRSHWNADALRDVVRDHVIETLGAPEAVLVIDETGFLKQGHASCGVGRQYTGSAGKITNCQIGVFAAYVSDKGHAFIDRQLYRPKAWTGDPARMTAAHVPAGIPFATKPHLALGMVERAIAAGVPFAWVTADTVYGVGEIELALRRADKGYVLGVTGQHSFWSWRAEVSGTGTAEEIATALVEEDWIRLSAGAGTKGPRLWP